MIGDEKEFPDNPPRSDCCPDDLAKAFCLMHDEVRIRNVLAKYGYDVLLKVFAPVLCKLEYPPARRALRLLRREISVEEFLT